MTRAERIRAVIEAIQARGEQPSPKKILDDIGAHRVNNHSLNGRESRLYAAEMRRLGYVLVRMRNGQHRWTTPERAAEVKTWEIIDA